MITAALGLDISGFSAGANAASRLAGQFSSAGLRMAAATLPMANAVQIASFALNSLGAILGVVSGSLRGLADNMIGAVKYARDLQNMAMEAGVAIEQLIVLQGAFSDVGISADESSQAISAMQRRLVEAAMFFSGEGAKAFRILHLNARQLAETKTPVENFVKIREEIDKVKNSALRNELAFNIWGKSGRKMLQIDTSKLREISALMKTQMQVVSENVGMLARMSSTLEITKQKIKGFWVGFTARMAPVIMPMLEELRTVDFAKLGLGVGTFFAKSIKSITAGAGEIKIMLVDIFSGAISGILNAIVAGIVGLLKIFLSPSTYTAALTLVLDLLAKAVSAIGKILLTPFQTLDAIAQSIPVIGPKIAKSTNEMLSKADEFFQLPASFVEGAADFGRQATKKWAAKESEWLSNEGFSQDVFGASRSFEKVKGAFNDMADANNEAAAQSRAIAGQFPAEQPTEPGKLPTFLKTVMEVASITKVGGGGGFAGGTVDLGRSALEESRKQTSILQNIHSSIQDLNSNDYSSGGADFGPAVLQ